MLFLDICLSQWALFSLFFINRKHNGEEGKQWKYSVRRGNLMATDMGRGQNFRYDMSTSLRRKYSLLTTEELRDTEYLSSQEQRKKIPPARKGVSRPSTWMASLPALENVLKLEGISALLLFHICTSSFMNECAPITSANQIQWGGTAWVWIGKGSWNKQMWFNREVLKVNTRGKAQEGLQQRMRMGWRTVGWRMAETFGLKLWSATEKPMVNAYVGSH